MSSLFLIPARGGSKGIPDKNIKLFCGKSLVVRAVEQAFTAREIIKGSHLSLDDAGDLDDVIFVSTDSLDIQQEALNCGIESPFLRPENLASDSASTYDVIVHALEEFKIRGKEFQNVVLLQPTSPLRTVDDIVGAYNLWSPEIDMVVSVSPSKSNPYFNLFEPDSNGFLKISKGNGSFTRRQDAPTVWEYNGAVYVMTVKSLLKSPISGFMKIIPYEMPAARSVDLDTPQDWEIAEFIFSRNSISEI